jgi:hypothetical protein
MAGPQKWTEQLVQLRLKDGRGTGTLEGFSPWMYVQEFSSRGTQTRIPSVKLRRVIHTFSYLERALFLVKEFEANFWDFNEQRAMDRAITQGFAKSLGIRHPRYPKSNVPIVMTLDAVTTEIDPDGVISVAGWDVKPLRALSNSRVLAKLSLHKAYCAHVGMPHYIFTETSVPRNVVRNIDYLRMALPRDGEIEVTPGLLTWRQDEFLEDLFKCRTRPSISHFCARYDAGNKLEPGTGLRLFKLLAWKRRVQLDLDVKWLEQQPIPRWNDAVAPLQLLRRAA